MIKHRQQLFSPQFRCNFLNQKGDLGKTEVLFDVEVLFDDVEFPTIAEPPVAGPLVAEPPVEPGPVAEPPVAGPLVADPPCC
jgi:hypothetical protein